MYGIDTTGSEVLQPKGPLNQRAIESIITQKLRQEAIGARFSGAWAPHLAHPTQTRSTVSNLTRAVERHEAWLHGMRNSMAAKAAYDCSMGEAMCARLDALILRNGVDFAMIPEVTTYLENLTRPWNVEEPPYEEEEQEDDEEDNENGTRH